LAIPHQRDEGDSAFPPTYPSEGLHEDDGADFSALSWPEKELVIKSLLYFINQTYFKGIALQRDLNEASFPDTSPRGGVSSSGSVGGPREKRLSTSARSSLPSRISKMSSAGVSDGDTLARLALSATPSSTGAPSGQSVGKPPRPMGSLAGDPTTVEVPPMAPRAPGSRPTSKQVSFR
jgi:hypothetical protein